MISRTSLVLDCPVCGADVEIEVQGRTTWNKLNKVYVCPTCKNEFIIELRALDDDDWEEEERVFTFDVNCPVCGAEGEIPVREHTAPWDTMYVCPVCEGEFIVELVKNS